MSEIQQLGSLIREHNSIGSRIAAIIARPATIGHTGEFIASRIFDIELEPSAVAKGIDGRFKTGPLQGRSVNIKWYGKWESILDLTPSFHPDFYLVMTGPKALTMTSKGGIRPWLIDFVFLFDAAELSNRLVQRGVNIGVATSVQQQVWLDAEIYPRPTCKLLSLNSHQREQLAVFGSVE